MKNNSQVTWFNNNIDTHAKWTINIANKIKDVFPECGIGIAGSISLGMHTKKSDIDLLIIDNSFKKNMQCVFFKDNAIETNLLCLNPNLLENRFIAWAKQFNGQHITYINMVNIIYDPNLQLKRLKKSINKLITDTKFSNTEFYKNCVSDVVNLSISSKRYIDISEYKTNKLRTILNLWFIKHNIRYLNKKDNRKAFETIKEYDYKFYKLLKEVLFNNSEVDISLKNLYNMVVGSAKNHNEIRKIL